MKHWRTPLDLDKNQVAQGELHILWERCKGCAFCVEYCPKKILELSPEFNEKGYHPPILLKKGACVNCRLCEMICPEFAIFSLGSTSKSPDVEDVLAYQENS